MGSYHFPGLACVVLLSLPSFGSAQAKEARAGCPPWVAGDSWELELKIYARYGPLVDPDRSPVLTHLKHTYRMSVRVIGLEAIEGSHFWQLDFEPSREAPIELRQKTRVLVHERDGWVQSASSSAGSLEDRFIRIGEKSVLLHPPVGLPAELFPFSKAKDELKVAENPHWLKFSRRELPTALVMEATIFSGQTAHTTVKQVWHPGEKWWREYERHYEGRRDLIARQLNPPTMIGKKPGPDLPAKSPTSEPPKQAKDESTAQKTVAAAKPTSIGEAPLQMPTAPPPALKPWQTQTLAAIGLLLAATLGLLGFYYWRNRKAA